MTNLDKIRKMSAKQLSKILKWDCSNCSHYQGGFDCDAAGMGCEDACREWLESSVKRGK